MPSPDACLFSDCAASSVYVSCVLSGSVVWRVVVAGFVLIVRANNVRDASFDDLGNGPPKRPGVTVGLGVGEEVVVELDVSIHGVVDLGKESFASGFVFEVIVGGFGGSGFLLKEFRKNLGKDWLA